MIIYLKPIVINKGVEVMKKEYVTPIMVGEEFSANEYVAACWGVGCSVYEANQIERNMNNYNYPNLYHGPDHCGLSGNQVIYDDNNDKVADRMVEVGTDGLGTLTCTIYTDSNYNQTRDVSSVKTGETIYWTTAAGDKVWHHVGTVYQTVPGHPNRS